MRSEAAFGPPGCGDRAAGAKGVREGSRVLALVTGRAVSAPSPRVGRGLGGEGRMRAVEIEYLRPGDLVMTHRARLRAVLAVARSEYRGEVIAFRRGGCETLLWAAPGQLVATPLLRPPRPRARVAVARELRRSSTHSEDLLWESLRNRRLGRGFRRQHVLGPYVVDFYCPELRLAVEVDGLIHRGREVQAYDRFRQEMIEQCDIAFLRLPNEEVERGLDEVLARIATVMAQREMVIAHGTRWVPAGSLVLGSMVLCEGRAEATPVAGISRHDTVAVLRSLSVSEDHSYVTEVCTVHD
jgi:adenine-specific DNA-methyltransferase